MAKIHQSDQNAYRFSMLRRLEKSKVDSERTRIYKDAVYKWNKHLHENLKDVIRSIQCLTENGYSVPRMECILRKSPVCPQYKCIANEKELNKLDPPIWFH